MKINLKEFIKPNKFKISFSLLFILVTVLVFLTGDYFDSRILEIIFIILSFPALFFAWNFQFLPMFKRCWVSFGEEICSHYQTVALILAIPIFIIYVYIVSCLAYSLVNKNKVNSVGRAK